VACLLEKAARTATEATRVAATVGREVEVREGVSRALSWRRLGRGEDAGADAEVEVEAEEGCC
jgi:CO/xanthine dehydrogenase Mo-binding subunit